MQKRIFLLSLLLLLGLALASFHAPANAQQAVVKVVFFYSPTCSHCHEVQENVFPVLRETYGEQLLILQLDVSQPRVQGVWSKTLDKFQLEGSVPTLIVGDQVLVGGVEIPEQLPGLIDTYLAAGGVNWPAIAGIEPLAELIGFDEGGQIPSVGDIFMRDPLGNSVSVVVLLGLLVVLVTVSSPRRWFADFSARFARWGMLALLIVALLVASYLSYVEVTQTEAVCGAVGDCNAVQQSSYALIFGFLPVAVFGLLGDIAILATYVYTYWIKKGPYIEKIPALTFGLALFGLLFSIYLTYLEPFVIGATCMWCLTSAVCVALLTLLSAGPGWAVLWPRYKFKRRTYRKKYRKAKKSAG